MSHLARKVTLSKWSKIEDAISADAITSCLRTTKNTLSFWVVPQLNISHINEVVLAMASGGEKIDKIDLILIHGDFFNNNNISIVEEPGNTKVPDLINSHRDAINLNLPKIAALSDEILSQIDSAKGLTAEQLNEYLAVKSFTIKEIKEILKQAINAGRLERNTLSEKIQTQLG